MMQFWEVKTEDRNEGNSDLIRADVYIYMYMGYYDMIIAYLKISGHTQVHNSAW